MPKKPAKRGRRPYAWLTGQAIAMVPVGTVLAIDLGDHRGLFRERVVGTAGSYIIFESGLELDPSTIVRARVVGGMFDPGQLVVRLDTPVAEWRGGVIRSEGRSVFVESTVGLEWLDEAVLGDAEAGSLYARARIAAES